MNDIENFIGSDGNDDYISVVPGYLLDLESDSSDTEETQEEFLDGNDESGIEEESYDTDLSRSGAGSSSDYTVILTDIEGRLENLENASQDTNAYLSTIVDNTENISFIKDSTVVVANCFVMALIVCLFVLTYNALSNWFR